MLSNLRISGCPFLQGLNCEIRALSRLCPPQYGWLGLCKQMWVACSWARGPAMVLTVTGLGRTPFPSIRAELPHGEQCCCACAGGMNNVLTT